MFANISFPISSYKTFIYKIPQKLIGKIKTGSCVNASINNRLHVGFVVSIIKETKYKGKVLEIKSVKQDEKHIPKELWKTIEWISRYYITPLGKVLKVALPNAFFKSYNPKEIKFVKLTSKGLISIKYFDNNKPAQKRIIEALSNYKKPIKIVDLKKYSSSPYIVCKQLEKNKLVKIILQPQISDPFDIMGPGEKKDIVLSNEQQKVMNKIKTVKNKFKPYLLHGVTGSGKTEIYLKLAQSVVYSGKSVLVLVPEISLTPQIARRFRDAFGSSVALWHSKMTKAEKGWTWKMLRKNQYSVIVGARSAIFTPLKNLGLIIIDEEQESTYKQDNSAPKYHARDVAMIRGRYANAIVLLTSATPCLESYYNALQKKFKILKLSKRFGNSTYPSVKLVDMKKEYLTNNKQTILSKVLIENIKDRLKKSEQIILLQNRRGYANVQQCLNCGTIKQCSKCSVSLTFHQTDNNLHCHYCQSIIPIFIKCKECNSEKLIFSGTGTQKVEDELLKIFPEVKILRMDMDTVKSKGSHQNILDKFSNKESNILLGTQMIAKGLDFDNVTLVGIINADSGLFFPDFRSGERIFQLIYQVSGRAGRRNKPGFAIIQTYNPDNIYIKSASILDINKFYNIELAQRQELNYPPFSRMGRIIFSGKNKIKVEKLANWTEIKLQGDSNFIILGPVLAPIEKIKESWRSHIIIKTKNKDSKNIHQLIKNTIGFSIFERKWNGVRIQIDIDPVSML